MTEVTMTRCNWDEDEVMTRAYRALAREQRRECGMETYPSYCSSGTEEHDGRDYAVLRNCNGILKVYRILADGALQGLRTVEEWPAELQEEDARGGLLAMAVQDARAAAEAGR